MKSYFYRLFRKDLRAAYTKIEAEDKKTADMEMKNKWDSKEPFKCVFLAHEDWGHYYVARDNLDSYKFENNQKISRSKLYYKKRDAVGGN